MREKDKKKRRATEAEENRRRKSKEKQVRKNEDRLRGLESCEALVHSILTIGMDYINNLKMKDIRVIICYHFRSEKLKGIPKKVELVDAVEDFLEWIGTVFCIDGGCGVSDVTNEGVHESGEEMGEIYIYI